LLQVAEAAGQIGNVIELLTLQALALEAQGESVQATTTLHRALTLAEPEGYIRTFVDEGEPMRRLIADCRSWIEKQSHSEAQKLIAYAGRLLTAFPQAESAPLPAIIHQPSKLVEPLSERELEVLRLIADGFSNAEIGAKLFIAVGTVKRHINNIYGKLDVQSRTQAVARARELGLL
jgi:LuxR family maltose regulon positive regulatory protein